jgi:hypothetical protein
MTAIRKEDVMKKVLLLSLSLMMLAGAAMADHIAIYADPTGSVCNLAPGFSTTATIIHKFSAGATASRFRMELNPGSVFFAISTPYVTIGGLDTDISIGYGACLTGSFPLGTIVALWAPGTVSIVAAFGQSNIIYADCNFAERIATGGHTSINGDGHGCDFDPVQPTSWGKVKALYR